MTIEIDGMKITGTKEELREWLPYPRQELYSKTISTEDDGSTAFVPKDCMMKCKM